MMWKRLGYLGLIPFIFCLDISTSDAWMNEGKQAFIAYSAIILSFMAGSLWQIDQHRLSHQQVISNIFCLIAFSALLVDQYLALIILALCYLCLFIYEVKFVRLHSADSEYIAMRFRLTIIVVLLHVGALILW